MKNDKKRFPDRLPRDGSDYPAPMYGPPPLSGPDRPPVAPMYGPPPIRHGSRPAALILLGVGVLLGAALLAWLALSR